MWETWIATQSMRCKPSDLLGLQGSIAQYYFDRAVWAFGSAVQAELDAVEDAATRSKSKTSPKTIQARKQMVLNKWIPAPESTKGRYKDPAIGAFGRPQNNG